MATVYNWQISRNMEYPYEVPRPKRQFSAVFDTNKCIACQTCTVACKNTWTAGRGQEYMFWNNVETKPYGGYPLAWDSRLLQKLGGGSWKGNVYTGKTIFEKALEEGQTNATGILPSLEDWAYPNIGEDEICGEPMEQGMHINALPHMMWFHYVARLCNHCTYPGCASRCPRQAIYKRKEDGVVLIDQKRCNGYKQCNEGCPYKKAMYNSFTGRSEKCVACYPKMEGGLTTQCMEVCIGKIRMQGWLNTPENAEEDNPLDYLVHFRKLALPLYPQFGTEPNIYYIPPINVPIPFIKQMFGPRVERAVEIYRTSLKQDKTLQGLILLSGSSPQIMTRFEVKNDVARGWNAAGELVATIPITEPPVIRAAYDKSWDVYRTDIT